MVDCAAAMIMLVEEKAAAAAAAVGAVVNGWKIGSVHQRVE
jgi:hypothetical protein